MIDPSSVGDLGKDNQANAAVVPENEIQYDNNGVLMVMFQVTDTTN